MSPMVSGWRKYEPGYTAAGKTKQWINKNVYAKAISGLTCGLYVQAIGACAEKNNY